MRLVGLTGGIASGKSTVAARMRAQGLPVIDADAVAREVVAAGTDGLAEIRAAFGDEVIGPDGELDRPALGRIVFGDDAARARLNAIVHPKVGAVTAERVAELHAAGETLVVHDVPLLVENDLAGAYGDIVVVAVAPETQRARLVKLRGMSEEDAAARIAAQASLEERLAVATHVIWNDGTVEELDARVDEVIARLRAAAGGPPEERPRRG